MSNINIFTLISIALLLLGCFSNSPGGGAIGRQDSSTSPTGIYQSHTPMTTSSPTPTPQPHFSIEAPSGLEVKVGQTLQLRAKLVQETLHGNETILWKVDEKFREYATVDGTGLVKLLRPGSVPVYLNVDTRRAKALLAVVEPGLFAQQIQLPPDVSNEAPRGAELGSGKLINSQSEWERFWKENLKTYYRGEPITPLPPAPSVDFSSTSVIAWFDIQDNNERMPVVTTMNNQAGAIDIAFPNTVAYPYNITTTGMPTVFLFKIDKVDGNPPVHIHHLRE